MACLSSAVASHNLLAFYESVSAHLLDGFSRVARHANIRLCKMTGVEEFSNDADTGVCFFMREISFIT